jgi:histidine triad (HIT) family protein
MESCIFCKIITKEIPANIVYEDEEILAFKDILPVAPVHILIIPKKHIESLIDLKKEDKDLIGKIYLCINEIAKNQGIYDKGFRVIANCGKDGGQVVNHIHFHLIGGKKLGAKICK